MNYLHSTSGAEAHLLLETGAYLIGAQVYWRRARRSPQPPARIDRWWLLACVVFGAALGSKALHVLEHLGYFLHDGGRWEFLGGKSILGGLIGGTLKAEAGKRSIGWRSSTEDA